ncbi:hypothetical protein CVH10_19865 [Halomonas sp. ND22Bw]|nr:hypothetical protein CVH10_19865 [Halomonas sp. ND22Bw]
MKLDLDIRVENIDLMEWVAETMGVDVTDVLCIVVEMGCEIVRKSHGITSGQSEMLKGLVPA